MQREKSWRTEADVSLKHHAVGVMDSSTESYAYPLMDTSSDLEKSFANISVSTDNARPNPEDLPDPVFENVAALVNNEYQPHLRYSSGEAESRASIFVDAKLTEDDVFKPIQPLELPQGNGGDRWEQHMRIDPHQHSQHEKARSPPKSPYCSSDRADGQMKYGRLSPSKDRTGNQACKSQSSPQRATYINGHKVGDHSPVRSCYNSGDSNHAAPKSPRSSNKGTSVSADSATLISQHPGSSTASNLKGQSNSIDSKPSQPCTNGMQDPENILTKPVQKTVDRQDSSASVKYYESGIVDDFVNIDVMSDDGSPSTRPRSENISEPSRSAYETKRSGKGAEKGDDSLNASNSESNLDFNRSWTCDYCTFINSDEDKCEVCGIPRKRT